MSAAPVRGRRCTLWAEAPTGAAPQARRPKFWTEVPSQHNTVGHDTSGRYSVPTGAETRTPVGRDARALYPSIALLTRAHHPPFPAPARVFLGCTPVSSQNMAKKLGG